MAQAHLLPESPVSLPPISYKGQPVVTTEMLAQAYGCSAGNIHDNFRKNKDRFIEGKHFFTLTNGEIKAFRDCTENFRSVVPARTRNLTLWLERGAARHAKMLNTDQAWDVFEVLEETFFRVVRAESPQPALEATLTPSTTEDRRPLEKLVKVWCSLSGLAHAQAWTQVNAHFNLNSITELPVEWIPDALAFVQGKIDALPKALPAPESLPVALGDAVIWERELACLHDRALRKSMEIERWINSLERELATITGPLYKEVTRKVASGTPIISYERGVASLHESRYDAAENTRHWMRKLVSGIWQAAWFAKALHLKG